MANQQKSCRRKRSDSSCTCDSIIDCQDDSKGSTQKRNSTYIKDTSSAHNKQNNECSSECTNCKLLNRLYILLEEIVENRQKSKYTEEESKKNKYESETSKKSHKNNEEMRMSFKSYNEETRKAKCNNDNTGPNKSMLCNCCKCDKTNLNSNGCTCKMPKNMGNSAQYWHSVGEMKKQELVDFGCQCTSQRKDSSTQDYPEDETTSKNQKDKETLKMCDCAANTESLNNPGLQNFYCSLINDPKFRDAMKMACPNIVVLSNGCNCCNKCNTPLERTSVTTNTSDIIVTAPEKKEEDVVKASSSDCDLTNCIHMYPDLNIITLDTANQESNKLPRETVVTFPKKSVISREGSIFNKDIPSSRKSLEPNISRSIRKSQMNNNELIEDTTFIVPQDTDYTVAAALLPKSGKKKTSSKSKKRKNKASADSKESAIENNSLKNSFCQTEKKISEELKATNKTKDASVCCSMNCNAFIEQLNKKESVNNIAIPNQNSINSCNCKDIQNFVAIITELCAQMNKKSGEIVECECKSKDNSTRKQSVFPDTNKDDCVEIHRLAEKIAEIQIKSRNEYKNSIDVVKISSSDCDLTNCININPLPVNMADSMEECYCKICPCKKTTKHNRLSCPIKKEKQGRYSINPPVKRATKRMTEMEFANLNRWTQQYPPTLPQNNLSDRQNCTCGNYECMEETEIGNFNYNTSNYLKETDTCQVETCPEVRRIVKDCLCGSKNCYCHNEKLNELKTTAKLERLADEVISTISPCNCMGQSCPCNNTMDPAIRRNTTRQVCFSSIYHENQGKNANDAAKGKKLFDKDVNGNPCLNGSKSETNLYIKNLLDTKPKNKSCLKKKVIQSAKKLKPLLLKPLLPVSETACPQISYINSLFPDIYQALSKIKQLTNWEVLPQEIVEIVIDKILKREIRCGLQQMREGVIKINANGDGDNKKNTNILNILLEKNNNSAENLKEFENNILDKNSDPTKQNTLDDKNSCEERDTINLVEDNDNNIQPKLDTFNIDQKDFDLNKNPILVQINIEKERKSPSKKKNNVSFEHPCASLNENNVSSSSIYITENKLGLIKDLINANNNTNQELEDNESVSSSILLNNEANHPIAININIEMDKEKKLSLKDSAMNTEGVKTIASSTYLLTTETTPESTENKELKEPYLKFDKIKVLMDDLQEKKDLLDDLQVLKRSINDLHEKKKYNVEDTTPLVYHKKKRELPLLDDFLAMNTYMKVRKMKITPRNAK